MREAHHEFGDTAPCLRIAQKHRVDYSVTLAVTDYLLHGRWSVFYESAVDMPVVSFGPLLEDCQLVARDMQDRWAEGAS